MIFRRATFRLTLAYTTIQLGLFAVFAIGIYSFVTGNFDFDAADSEGEGIALGAQQGFDLLRTAFVAFYAVLVVIIPLSSFLMARAALSPIKASFERQQQFVDGASHEMRTPLSVIHGELELALSRSRTAMEYRAAIAVSLEGVLGLTRLTDDLLRLSRMTRDDLATTFDTVDARGVARRAVSRITDDRVTFSVRGGPAIVRGSEELLDRAVGNLVDNALKYSSQSRVQVVCSRGPDEVSIEVRDHGQGMSPSQVSHAFDRFWRGDASRTTPGHGLGLPLVKEIANAHGGSVTLDSEVGRGTTATLRLPMRIR